MSQGQQTGRYHLARQHILSTASTNVYVELFLCQLDSDTCKYIIFAHPTVHGSQGIVKSYLGLLLEPQTAAIANKLLDLTFAQASNGNLPEQY